MTYFIGRNWNTAQQQQPHLKSSLVTDKWLGLTLKPPDHKHQKTENLWYKNLATLHLGQKKWWYRKPHDVLSCSVASDSATPWMHSPHSMGLLQTRILEWVAMPSFSRSSQPRDRTQISRIAGKFFTIWVIFCHNKVVGFCCNLSRIRFYIMWEKQPL